MYCKDDSVAALKLVYNQWDSLISFIKDQQQWKWEQPIASYFLLCWSVFWLENCCFGIGLTMLFDIHFIIEEQ